MPNNAFTVYNDVDTAIDDLAELHKVHLAILAGATGGIAPAGASGVLEGGAVTAQGSPDNTVAVAIGKGRGGGRYVAWTAGNVTMTAAHATLARMDMVSVSQAGTKTYTAGTAAANPTPPDVPTGHVPLAIVYVPATDTTLSSDQIQDVRVFIQRLGPWVTVAANDSPTWMKAIADYVCDAVADNTEIQAAIDEADAYSDTAGSSSGAVPVILYPGVYRTSGTITAKSPAILNFGTTNSGVRIMWDGADNTGPMMTHSDTSIGGMSFFRLNNINFRNGTQHPSVMLDLSNASAATADSYCDLGGVQFVGGYTQLKWGKYVNVHQDRVRFDNWINWGISFKPEGGNNLSTISFSRFSFDARGTGATTGFCKIDLTANSSNVGLLHFSDARWEINNNWTGHQGCIEIFHATTETGTLTSGAAGTATKTGAGWDYGKWSNGTIQITGGTGSGQTKTINSNTATVITISGTFSPVPDATSTYTLTPSINKRAIALKFEDITYDDVDNGDGYMASDVLVYVNSTVTTDSPVIILDNFRQSGLSAIVGGDVPTDYPSIPLQNAYGFLAVNSVTNGFSVVTDTLALRPRGTGASSTNDPLVLRKYGESFDRFLMDESGRIKRGLGAAAPAVVFYIGSGTPEGNITADPGSVYQRTDGGVGSSLYMKESGTGNTGWFATGSAWPTRTITGNTTLGPTDEVVFGDASGGAFTLTLPTAVSITGKRYTLKKSDTSVNIVTIDPNGTETVEGFLTLGLNNPGASLTIISDGSNWRMVADAWKDAQSNTTVATAINTTAAETNFSVTGSLPANLLRVGKAIRFICRGVYGTHSTGTLTIQLKLKFGSTVIADTGAFTLIASQTNRGWEFIVDVIGITTGASGTVEGQGMAHFISGTLPASAAAITDAENTAVITVDTTATITVNVSAQHGASNSANTIQMRQLLIQQLN